MESTIYRYWRGNLGIKDGHPDNCMLLITCVVSGHTPVYNISIEKERFYPGGVTCYTWLTGRDARIRSLFVNITMCSSWLESVTLVT